MSQTCPTVKVKSDAADNEAGYVVINEADFDSSVHELFAPEGAKKAAGLNVDQLKAALTEKGVPIPEGAKKAELQALLDASGA